MKVGYVKISSAVPDAGRQLSLLQEQKVGRVFIDMKTGNNTDDSYTINLLIWIVQMAKQLN